ncbi:hypothetical protein HME9304_03147 [Flagellimonas maritima]|uniref:Uncharacterized protein n=1 Tax=Flagellimonas maritima TaxID=1383885 RepID=A0A2Z4LVY7_9FLAO|nr:hypothetical protein HME9304_03147 [Allomuricauda aurantiaca]
MYVWLTILYEWNLRFVVKSHSTHIALPPIVGQLIRVYSLLVICFLKEFMNLKCDLASA